MKFGKSAGALKNDVAVNSTQQIDGTFVDSFVEMK